MSDLLPCPFCGGKAYHTRNHFGGEWAYCNQCASRSYTPDIWNKRANADARQDKWQPITTAPMDGSNVLLANGDFVTMARWYEAKKIWVDAYDFTYSKKYFTHWTPLPEPPKK